MFRKSLVASIVFALASISSFAIAGEMNGPRVAVDKVILAGTFDRYVFTFERDKEARVAVAGNGTSDLDCFLYDQNGNQIDNDTDNTDTCLIKVVPNWTGPFAVVVKNVGDRVNIYTLETN